jgi:DNA-binding CsgD family transcriptional regulator
VRAALKAGARGYVSKGVDADELVATARKIIAGQSYVSPELAARLVTEGEDLATSTLSKPMFGRLTPREQQIIELMGIGHSNQEIADHLGLSENTVKHYITPLLRKLGVRNRTEAALLIQAKAKSHQTARDNAPNVISTALRTAAALLLPGTPVEAEARSRSVKARRSDDALIAKRLNPLDRTHPKQVCRPWVWGNCRGYRSSYN